MVHKSEFIITIDLITSQSKSNHNSLRFQISILPCLIVQYQHRIHVSRETSSCQMSGLYRAAYFTGAFFGPVMGGLMLEHMKYLDAYIALACVLAANLTILVVVEMIFPLTIEVSLDRQGSYETLDSENSD